MLFCNICHHVSDQADKLALLAIILLLANVLLPRGSPLEYVGETLVNNKIIARRANLSA